MKTAASFFYFKEMFENDQLCLKMWFICSAVQKIQTCVTCVFMCKNIHLTHDPSASSFPQTFTPVPQDTLRTFIFRIVRLPLISLEQSTSITTFNDFIILILKKSLKSTLISKDLQHLTDFIALQQFVFFRYVCKIKLHLMSFQMKWNGDCMTFYGALLIMIVTGSSWEYNWHWQHDVKIVNSLKSIFEMVVFIWRMV